MAADPHSHILSRIRGQQSPTGTSVHAFHWHVGKAIPWFYGTGVALGVPFLSTVPLFSLKLIFAFVWAFWSVLYLWLSQRELQAHARLYGSLSVEEVNTQVGDPWKIVIGIVVAFFIWIVGFVGHWSWPSYGLVEWAVLACSALTAFVESHLTNRWVLSYQRAVASQERFQIER
jgi:hypothetical protein